jgi:hypothetical protein
MNIRYALFLLILLAGGFLGAVADEARDTASTGSTFFSLWMVFLCPILSYFFPPFSYKSLRDGLDWRTRGRNVKVKDYRTGDYDRRRAFYGWGSVFQWIIDLSLVAWLYYLGCTYFVTAGYAYLASALLIYLLTLRVSSMRLMEGSRRGEAYGQFPFIVYDGEWEWKALLSMSLWRHLSIGGTLLGLHWLCPIWWCPIGYHKFFCCSCSLQ